MKTDEWQKHLWIPTRKFEQVDAYPIPQLPIVCRRRELPTYAPTGMCTEPVSFPSIVTGHDSGPVEVARHPPPYHYCCSQSGNGGQCRCMEGHLGFERDVERELLIGKLIGAELEAQHKWLQAEAAASSKALRRIASEKTSDLQRKIDCLRSKLEQLLLECRELENAKRQLQAAEQAVQAPQLIAQNCIRLRSSGRQGADLRNDEVDELLADEVHNCEDRQTTLGKCLDQIDYELLQTKTMQYELEQFLQRLEWATKVDKSDAAILRLGQAPDLRTRFACLVSQADEMLKRSQEWRRKARTTMESASKSILTRWCATSKALEANVEEIRRAKAKIKYSACKDAEDAENAELIKRSEAQLESLRVTKNNLDAELVAKCNSQFVDEHKCMTMRKAYPISILWKCLHETIL
uniref:Tektin n=1 Tax=Trichogramma kaykai TaxID=54128 RepID=A0ABD2XAF6_9HYME